MSRRAAIVFAAGAVAVAAAGAAIGVGVCRIVELMDAIDAERHGG